MAHAGGHEAGYASEGLEDDEAPHQRRGRGVVVRVASDEVERVVEAIVHEAVHHLVGERLWHVLVTEGSQRRVELVLGPDVILLPPSLVEGEGARLIHSSGPGTLITPRVELMRISSLHCSP